MRVAALIPALDEAETIADVVRGIGHHVHEIVVVDDGSRDGTGALAAEAGAEVVTHERPGGKGTAIRSGLTHLLRRDTLTHILCLDADLQHRPDEAPRLLAAAASTSADLVIGVRQFERAAMPASRYHANRIGSRALSSFVGTAICDTQCGYRLFRRDILDGLRLRARGYEIETEMLVKVRRRGGRIVEVPVSAVYGQRRSKLRPVRDTTRTCFLAVYYRFLESD